MLISTLALTQIYQSDIDHRTALAIWNRARNAHGFNTKYQNGLRWVHNTPQLRVDFLIAGFDDLYQFTTLPGQEMTYKIRSEGYAGSQPFESYSLRLELLKHPAGVLTSPPAVIQKPLNPNAFTLTVKGITINVYLDPKTDRIDYIEYSDPTPGVRKFSNYYSYYDYIRPGGLWLPESWQSGSDLQHLGDRFDVTYGTNICFPSYSIPWIPEGFDIVTPDIPGLN